jgi:hypothetical protein
VVHRHGPLEPEPPDAHYLRRRGHTWFFRWKWPARLAARGFSGELIRSLKTCDFRIARWRALNLVLRIEAMTTGQPLPSRAELEALVRSWIDACAWRQEAHRAETRGFDFLETPEIDQMGREHAAELEGLLRIPSGVRERAYEAQLTAAYPVHPELFLMLQTDWGGLERFQKTRGVLKMMAQIVYRLWRDGHAAPMILPGDVPLTDDKVRANALVPLPNGYDAVISKEVANDLSKPAQIKARSPAIGKNRAVTRAATALLIATAPHGSTNRGMEIARLRLACAIPGEQPSQFSEALRRLGENAAYLYSSGENY